MDNPLMAAASGNKLITQVNVYGWDDKDGTMPDEFYAKYFKEINLPSGTICTTMLGWTGPQGVHGDFYIGGGLQAVDIDYPPDMALTMSSDKVEAFEEYMSKSSEYGFTWGGYSIGDKFVKGPMYDYWDW